MNQLLFVCCSRFLLPKLLRVQSIDYFIILVYECFVLVIILFSNFIPEVAVIFRLIYQPNGYIDLDQKPVVLTVDLIKEAVD